MTAIKADGKNRKGWFEIEVALANDGEDKKVFVGGCDEGDFLITRGQKVIVPASVLGRLDDAVMLVPETTNDESGNGEAKVATVPRRRFAYSVLRAL